MGTASTHARRKRDADQRASTQKKASNDLKQQQLRSYRTRK